MFEANTQTYLAAWPAPSDLPLPRWLLHLSPLATGCWTGLAMFATFRAAVMLGSIWWAVVFALLMATAACALWMIISCQSGCRRGVSNVFLAVSDRPRRAFMLTPGMWLAAAIFWVIRCTRLVGIGLGSICVAVGYLGGSLLVDRCGIGWNTPRSISFWQVSGGFIFCIGLAFYNLRWILNLDDCVAPPLWALLGAVGAVLAGISLTLQHAALLELRQLIGTPSRAIAVACGSSAILLAAAAWIFADLALSELILSYEAISYLLFAAVSLPLILALTILGTPLGTAALAASHLVGLVATAAPCIIFDLTSLPFRTLDIGLVLGFAICWLGYGVLMVGARVITVKGWNFNRFASECEEAACAICVRNDRELMTDEYQRYKPCDPDEPGDAERKPVDLRSLPEGPSDSHAI